VHQIAVIVAAIVATGAAVVAHLVTARVQPQAAARAICQLAVLSALATLWALVVISSENIVQLHFVAEALSLCRGAFHHRETMTPAGWIAVIGVFACLYSASRVRRRQRRLRAPAGNRGLSIVPSDAPTAFALPGRPGQIIISTGMLRSLEPDERRVLLAHERAHLRCHHHRYVRLTQLAAAVLPLLARLNARVRFATERWADEEAAREMADRTVVARAIARAALAQTAAPVGVLAIADTGVARRVESLLREAPPRSRWVEYGLQASVAVAAAGLGCSIVLTGPPVAHVLGFGR
jgi:Zn-dependent protease with chaperone function